LLPKGISEDKLIIAGLDATGKWVPLTNIVVDKINHIISGDTKSLTSFVVMANVNPASFSVGSLSVTPAEVAPKQSVSISAVVNNSGDLSGSYTVTLKVGGTQVDSQTITLAGGSSQTVSFSTAQDAAGTYTVDVNGLSGSFVVKAAPTPPAPATFTVSSLAILPAEVNVKDSVAISTVVKNTGGTTGTYTVTLKINGVAVDSKNVSLDGGASQKVTFTVSRDTAGAYTVDVNGLTGQFTVKGAAAPPVTPVKPGVSPWLIAGIILLVIIVVGVIILVRRRK
jgi:uncharacterized protein (DUF2147 family)